MSKENGISRRDFLKTGVVGAAALVLPDLARLGKAEAGEGGFSVQYPVEGVPERASDVLTVEVANKKFGGAYLNEIKNGSEMMFAEPGTLLVGPDFSQDIINSSGGAIERFNPTNQDVIDNKPPAFANVPEGGFLWTTAGYLDAEVDGKKISLEGIEGHNWFLVIRGLSADGKQDADRNRTIEFKKYAPGHIQWMRYPNGAFISEGALEQTAAVSHTGGTNCGAEGCSGLSVMMLDLNTGGWAVMNQRELDGEWKLIYKNWQE